jgi:hypothetical protein
MSLPSKAHLDRACYAADWVQVALNGGPPCFHFEEDRGRFCLRALRWAGHTHRDEYPEHKFVSLSALLDLVREEEGR